MSLPTARWTYLQASYLGSAAGIIASTIQVIVGFLLDKLLLPRGHDNNIAPRLANRSFRKAGQDMHPVVDWVAGMLFHYAYGLGWGVIFGLVRRWSKLPSLFIGGALGWLIYLLAFSRQGIGTKTGAEQHPKRRPWQKQVSLVAVAFTYALATALTYDRLEEKASPPAP